MASETDRIHSSTAWRLQHLLKKIVNNMYFPFTGTLHRRTAAVLSTSHPHPSLSVIAETEEVT